MRPFTERDTGRWIDYVAERPAATLFHDHRWLEAVAEAYGFASFHLIAERSGKICGVLPLALAASPLLGRSLISTAFGIGGGIVADDAAAAEALGREARALGVRLRVNYVELRGGAAPGEGWVTKEGLYESFEKEMPDDVEKIRDWLPRNRRAEVRKSLRIDEANEDSFRIDQRVDDFYNVYATALRNLGTPAMPKKFLRILKEKFGDDADIALVERNGEPVAGLFSFWRQGRVMPYYIGGGEVGRNMRAYDYLYYSLMRRAVARGVRLFDFGRSKVGSTHSATKTYWGFEPKPLVYHVALIRAKELPNVNPNNPKFTRFVQIWKRLPLPLANILGPIAARNFP
ncbi:MAG: FemAB family XrtA/PEP-CTERM system-associated protein [Parvularculaceae bacterium]|nr:FemAB family XrtA/PEP-CTERM system-associated protein [Parvularculaceae bacterium]